METLVHERFPDSVLVWREQGVSGHVLSWVAAAQPGQRVCALAMLRWALVAVSLVWRGVTRSKMWSGPKRRS